jgi:hypothetical protein
VGCGVVMWGVMSGGGGFGPSTFSSPIARQTESTGLKQARFAIAHSERTFRYPRRNTKK